MHKHAAILGDGTMATAIATAIARKGLNAVMWSPDEEVVGSINKKRTHPRHFPAYNLPSQLIAVTSLEEAVSCAALAVVAVKSERVRELAAQLKPFIISDTVVVSATKGIERGTNKPMSQVIIEEIPSIHIGVLSGPNITYDIMESLPTALLLASNTEFSFDVTSAYIESKFLKVFGSRDLIGIEILSVLKNIVTIAAGLAVNLGDNARSYVIALGLAEIHALARKIGARPESFGGLADFGEVFLSSTSKYSRNHMIGVEVANGAHLAELMSTLEAQNETAEGVNAIAACGELAAAAGIEMPLAECVYRILFENLPATETLREFLSEKNAAKWLPLALA